MATHVVKATTQRFLCRHLSLPRSGTAMVEQNALNHADQVSAMQWESMQTLAGRQASGPSIR